MMHHAPFGLLVVVAALGTIGNVLIIGAVCIYKRLRVKGHVFVVNLAIADLIITSYIMPVGLATSQFHENPFGSTMCNLNAFLIMTSCGVSTQTLMAISLERYFHICKTGQYRKIFTNKLLVFYVLLIWIYTMAWTCQGWTGWTDFEYNESMYICIFDGKESISYNVCLAIVGMFIPMVVVAVTYCLIFLTVKKSRKAMEAHRKRVHSSSRGSNMDTVGKVTPDPDAIKRMARNQKREYQFMAMLLTIVVVFGICWAPATFVFTFSGIWSSMPQILWPIAIWLAFCNSGMNSLIYGVMNKHFRTGYMELFEYMFCCKRTSCSGACRKHHPKEDSGNSQSRLTGNPRTSHNISPTTVENFRFTKAHVTAPGNYGSNSTTNPVYQEISENPNIVTNGAVVNGQPATPLGPGDLYHNERNYLSAQSGDVWHYPVVRPYKPVEYIYDAYTSGNSSIITIESTLSEESDYANPYGKIAQGRKRENEYIQSLGDYNNNNNDILNHHPYHRKTTTGYSGDGVQIEYHRPSPRNRRLSSNTSSDSDSQTRRMNVVSIHKGDTSPIYEVPFVESGELILPTQVTPVIEKRLKSKSDSEVHIQPRYDMKRLKMKKETVL